jgi:hypothetical protein
MSRWDEKGGVVKVGVSRPFRLKNMERTGQPAVWTGQHRLAVFAASQNGIEAQMPSSKQVAAPSWDAQTA